MVIIPFFLCIINIYKNKIKPFKSLKKLFNMKTAIKISVITVFIFFFGYETAHPMFDTVASWIGPFFTRVIGISFTLLASYCAFSLFHQYGYDIEDIDNDLDEEKETKTSSK